MTLRNNDTQTLPLSRKTIQRIVFVVNLMGAGTLSTVLLELINCKIILKRDGRSYVIANDNLQILAQESMFFNGIEHALQKTAITISATQKMLPLSVDLGGVVNLTGDDELSIEITSKTGWMGDFDASQSSLEVEARDAIGVERAIPFINTKAIQATTSRVQETLGNNIHSIHLLNTEPARTDANADQVFTSVIITSDKYNCSDNRGRLVARRTSQFENVANAALRKENFVYRPKVQLDNCQITLELNGANVVSTKNYIVYRTFLLTKTTTSRSVNMMAKHEDRNYAKLQNELNG